MLRLVVVFSDGRATGNDVGIEAVTNAAVRSSTTVSVVAIGDKLLASSTVTILGRNDGLKQIANETGGAVFEMVEPKMQAIDCIVAMVAEARDRHRLEIEYPFRDTRQHKLSVRVGKASLRAPTHISR